MQQYINLEKLKENHQKLATRLTNHFTRYSSWQNDPITIFESTGDCISYEMKNGYLSDIMKKLKTKYPEIYKSINYEELAIRVIEQLDQEYYYYDDELGSIIMITPED